MSSGCLNQPASWSSLVRWCILNRVSTILSTAGAAWESLLVHWERLAVGRRTQRRLQQFIGRRSQWVVRPNFDHAPFLSGLWAIVLWGKPILPHTTP